MTKVNKLQIELLLCAYYFFHLGKNDIPDKDFETYFKEYWSKIK